MKLLHWINIRLIGIIVIMVFLFAFAVKRNENRRLEKSVVVFVGDNPPFVKQQTVDKLLIENRSWASSFKKVELDLNKLENTIDNHKMIEKSQVFVSIDGVLKAVVKQRTPIARFFNESNSFYLDYKGSIMPLSDNFTAHVPLVFGKIKQENNAQITDLFREVYDDVFLKENIIGGEILDNGVVVLRNRNYDCKIYFGLAQNIKEKFKKYKAFFQKADADSSLLKYKMIDLRFEKQVVCTK
jgi:cell division protein FtsQ